MQDLLSRLIATLDTRGPDDSEVEQLIARIEAAAGSSELAAAARALRTAWPRGQREAAGPKQIPAAEDEAMARMAARQGFDKELEALSAYTEGKMKRYNLLFAVNGGAFAIAKVLTAGPATGTPQTPVLVLLRYICSGCDRWGRQ